VPGQVIMFIKKPTWLKFSFLCWVPQISILSVQSRDIPNIAYSVSVSGIYSTIWAAFGFGIRSVV